MMGDYEISQRVSEARAVAPFKDIDLAEKNFIETPYLDQIWKNEGVLVPRLQPDFPASRTPFLASLLTGRHSDRHEVLY